MPSCLGRATPWALFLHPPAHVLGHGGHLIPHDEGLRSSEDEHEYTIINIDAENILIAASNLQWMYIRFRSDYLSYHLALCLTEATLFC
ncbi:hypothetical protein DFH06DRAFT_1467634 [Mycena polygramma]|nr:hypothetical protein DFH06DRAFT_1467634 [Mycena polygramma]